DQGVARTKRRPEGDRRVHAEGHGSSGAALPGGGRWSSECVPRTSNEGPGTGRAWTPERARRQDQRLHREVAGGGPRRSRPADAARGGQGSARGAVFEGAPRGG